MRNITIHLPETLEIEDSEITMILASKLYEGSRLSLGEAAFVAGTTKLTFTELLGKYGVSIFNYPTSDLSGDVKNA